MSRPILERLLVAMAFIWPADECDALSVRASRIARANDNDGGAS